MNASPAIYDRRLFLLDCIELLAVIFRGPDAQTCAGMILEGIPQLVSTNPLDEPHLKAALENLQASIPGPDRGRDAAGRFCSDLEPEYVRLFISAGGGVPAPLYESCHVSQDHAVMGDSALRMRDRLQEAGLEVGGPSNEPPDHLGIELEYLYFQLSKAWGMRDDKRLEHGVLFAGTVMLPWVRLFAASVGEAAPEGFFQRAAGLLVAVLELLAEGPSLHRR